MKRVLDLAVERDTNCLKMRMIYMWRREWPDEQSPLGNAISPSHPSPAKTVFSPLWANGTSGKWHVTLSGDWQGQAALSTSSFRLKRHVPDLGVGGNSSAMDPGRKTKLKLPVTASSEHTAQRKADIGICETLGLWCFVPAAQPGWRKGGQTAEHRAGL